MVIDVKARRSPYRTQTANAINAIRRDAIHCVRKTNVRMGDRNNLI